MKHWKLLGFLLSVAFLISRELLSLEFVPGFDVVNLIIIDTAILSILFLSVSAVMTYFSRRRVSPWETYQITGTLLIFFIFFQLVAFSFEVASYIADDVTGFIAASIYLTVYFISINGIELLLTSHLMNFFQSLSKIRPPVQVPLKTQLKVALSLIASLAAIFVIYYAAYYISSDVYVYGEVNGFMIIGGIPITIFIYLLIVPIKGVTLRRQECPELFDDVEEIARYTGAFTPDEIIIVPSSEVGVTGLFKTRLIIGIATLGRLRRDELRSLLAHEFGHFYGGDNLVGHLIATVSKSMELLVIATGRSIITVATFAIAMAFNVVTLGYSRQVEYRADIVSAKTYGGKTFARALSNYVEYSNAFQIRAGKIIKDILKTKTMSDNIYDVADRMKTDDDERKMLAVAMKNKVSILSTHPPTPDRITKVAGMTGRRLYDSRHACTYFKKFEELQKKSTDILVGSFFKIG